MRPLRRLIPPVDPPTAAQVPAHPKSPGAPPGAPSFLLRARVILPVHEPPIEDAFLWVRGGRIAATGRWRSRPRSSLPPVVDLGECAVFPGFVNAHAHLDLTGLAGRQIPGTDFCEWLKAVIAARPDANDPSVTTSWHLGARQLIETGTTSVANVEAFPSLLPSLRQVSPMRVFSFIEMTGVLRRADPAQLLAQTLQTARSLPPGTGEIGLSPHAPYSTRSELIKGCAALANAGSLRFTMHVAESPAEFDMFQFRRGPMWDWLGPFHPPEAAGPCTPVGHIDRLGLLGPALIAAHVNCIGPSDTSLLARRQVPVVHCPRSHAYFNHPPFPLATFRKAGIRVSLGTDSLASVAVTRGGLPTLSMLAEMQSLLRVHPGLSPAEVLAMGTLHGAHALGWSGLAGGLGPGSYADLAVIPFAGNPADATEAVVHHPGRVLKTMIHGAWVFGGPAGPDA